MMQVIGSESQGLSQGIQRSEGNLGSYDIISRQGDHQNEIGEHGAQVRQSLLIPVHRGHVTLCPSC